MKALRLLMIWTGCCATLTLGAASAAEPAAVPAAKAPAAESAAAATDEDSTAEQAKTAAQDQPSAADRETAAGAKPKASGKGGSPERFVPSEQVRADFDVSFPIDI